MKKCKYSVSTCDQWLTAQIEEFPDGGKPWMCPCSCLRVRAMGERLTLDFAEMLKALALYLLDCLYFMSSAWDSALADWDTHRWRIQWYLETGFQLGVHRRVIWTVEWRVQKRTYWENPKKSQNSRKLTPARNTVGKAIPDWLSVGG